MKIRSVVTLVGLAISFALPTFAQQTNTPDPQLRQQLINEKYKKYDEAQNNNDAAASAAFFTEDAVLVTNMGSVYGREAIEKWYAGLFKLYRHSNFIGKPDQYSPHTIGTAGNEIWEIGDWSLTYKVNGGSPVQLRGYWLAIRVREGDAWKTRMEMSNVAP